uniref:Uncharacterized protein n=1 Tax=Rhizophagus irregularis (strain DAOM 181602 / DAOM 197198 / MUCL 43194) TaxID=747089 RepID=U9T9B6_RHIID
MCRDQLLLVNAMVVFRKAWRSLNENAQSEGACGGNGANPACPRIRASNASLVNIGFMVVLAWIPGSFHSINRMDP